MSEVQEDQAKDQAIMFVFFGDNRQFIIDSKQGEYEAGTKHRVSYYYEEREDNYFLDGNHIRPDSVNKEKLAIVHGKRYDMDMYVTGIEKIFFDAFGQKKSGYCIVFSTNSESDIYLENIRALTTEKQQYGKDAKYALDVKTNRNTYSIGLLHKNFAFFGGKSQLRSYRRRKSKKYTRRKSKKYTRRMKRK